MTYSETRDSELITPRQFLQRVEIVYRTEDFRPEGCVNLDRGG